MRSGSWITRLARPTSGSEILDLNQRHSHDDALLYGKDPIEVRCVLKACNCHAGYPVSHFAKTGQSALPELRRLETRFGDFASTEVLEDYELGVPEILIWSSCRRYRTRDVSGRMAELR